LGQKKIHRKGKKRTGEHPKGEGRKIGGKRNSIKEFEGHTAAAKRQRKRRKKTRAGKATGKVEDAYNSKDHHTRGTQQEQKSLTETHQGKSGLLQGMKGTQEKRSGEHQNGRGGILPQEKRGFSPQEKKKD